jgi:glycosyltransferase involved in cell wall biosynthesis
VTVHLFEPGGSGGVFQHALAVADMLAEGGEDVILHTATDAELRPRSALFCGCVSWDRERAEGPWRSTVILWRYLTGTVPHIAARVSRQDCLHTQGRFKPGLLLVPALLARLRGARVVASPHNLFDRDRSLLGQLSLRTELRLADSVLVFSQKDQMRARRMGLDVIRSPLIMHLSPTTPDRVARWRSRWDPLGGKRVILFAGQLRPDKRLDLLIRAVAELPDSDWKLAVVGEDKGSMREMRALAARLGVDASWHVDYVDASDFVAAIVAADVIGCPYEVASQSAILAMAHQLGVPSVARDVGGLSELATATVASSTPSDIAAACVLAANQSRDQDCKWWPAALDAHMQAYGCGSK